MHPTASEPFAETAEKSAFWLQELMQRPGRTHPADG